MLEEIHYSKSLFRENRAHKKVCSYMSVTIFKYISMQVEVKFFSKYFDK